MMEETNSVATDRTINNSLSVFDEIRKYDNEKLRLILKEIKFIGSLDAPARIKYSCETNRLFEIEKNNSMNWLECYYNISNFIESEILKRIRENLW